MKVLIFSTAYEPLIGGAELAVRNITDRLLSYDFDLITLRFDQAHPKLEKIGNVIVHRVGFPGTIGKFFFPIQAFIRALKFKPDLVWGMDISQGSAAAALLRLVRPNIPFVFTVQYGYGEERVRRGMLGMINLAFRFMLQKADMVTVISKDLEKLVRKYGYNRNVEVIPNGVDVKNFQFSMTNFQSKSLPAGDLPKGDKFQTTIITTSRLVRKNGIDILIRAISDVRGQMSEVRCIIVGSGPEEKKLKQLASNLKVQDIVEFTGDVHPDKIPEYLGMADIFVRPSRSEGLGSSFLEAMAAGLPIIGTPVGGIVDFLIPFDLSRPIGHPPQAWGGVGGEVESGEVNGLFVRPEDPDDLAEKIKQLMDDENLRKRLGENGRRLVEERYNWNNIAQSMELIFSNLISRK